MTVTDAARLWGLSESRVRVLVRQGRVKAKKRKVGNLYAWAIPDEEPCPALDVSRRRKPSD